MDKSARTVTRLLYQGDRRTLDCLVRTTVAALLLFAAVSKVYGLALPTFERSVTNEKPFVLVVANIELLMGVWLVSGWRAPVLWNVTFSVFSVFLFGTLARAVDGAESCGCFGPFEVSPWVTASIDLAVLATLWASRNNWRTASPSVRSSTTLCVLGLMATLLLTAWGVRQSPVQPAADGVTYAAAGFVLLEPEKWVGTRMPLLKFIDKSQQLTHGDWEIMLHRHDCSKCQELLPDFVLHTPDRRALVEIPPFGIRDRDFHGIVNYHLREDFDWFVTTPCLLQLSGGIVQSVNRLSLDESGAISQGNSMGP